MLNVFEILKLIIYKYTCAVFGETYDPKEHGSWQGWAKPTSNVFEIKNPKSSLKEWI